MSGWQPKPLVLIMDLACGIEIRWKIPLYLCVFTFFKLQNWSNEQICGLQVFSAFFLYHNPAFTSTVSPLCVCFHRYTDSWRLLIEAGQSKQRRRGREKAGQREGRWWWIKAVEHYELFNHTCLTHTDWVCQLSQQPYRPAVLHINHTHTNR